MVVSIDKATALRMHDKVRRLWAAETERVKTALDSLWYPPPSGLSDVERARRQEQRSVLSARLDVLTSTDMAVIVSPGQNEIAQMKALGLDIEPHRKRMNEAQPGLDEQFKDTENPLRLVFVCAMWLTGFDAPSCSTVYLDKPMRNHTLMQTIARANRVYPGKHSGVIVDYSNVFVSLEKALAIYGGGVRGNTPVRAKDELVAELGKAVESATAFVAQYGVSLEAIEATDVGSLDRLSLLADAVNALISPETVRRDLLGHVRFVRMLYSAVKPDLAAIAFAGRVACLSTLVDSIQAKVNPTAPDISGVMGQIGALLDASIKGHAIREDGPPPLDLSKINFEALAQRFATAKHQKTELEALKAAVRAQLDRMVLFNKSRIDFAEKFEALIAEYNAGSATIEQLYLELLALSNTLSEEQQRHVRENLTEEELVIFDILNRPAPELSADERAEVKKVARVLLERLKELLVLEWREKSAARSKVRLAIEDTLDQGLPKAYTEELFRKKVSAVFEHVFEGYPEWGAGLYVRLSA
jgi:type I restriction enzyme R subunit